MSGENLATAQTSGNTKPEVFNAKKKRMFQLTLNYEQDPDIEQAKVILLKKYDTLMKYLRGLKYQYIYSCLETNEKGYYHIHIFIQFNTPHNLSIPKCEGAHIEECKGSINQNINYIKKEGTILNELGKPNYITGNPNIKDISLSRISDIHNNIDYRFYNVVKKIKQDIQPTFNTKKIVYLIDFLDDLDKNRFNDYQFFITKNKKIKACPHNLILTFKQAKNEKYLDWIFNKFNKPNNKFYPADIENIIIETNQVWIERDLITYHDLITATIHLSNDGEIDSSYNSSESIYEDDSENEK